MRYDDFFDKKSFRHFNSELSGIKIHVTLRSTKYSLCKYLAYLLTSL